MCCRCVHCYLINNLEWIPSICLHTLRQDSKARMALDSCFGTGTRLDSSTEAQGIFLSPFAIYISTCWRSPCVFHQIWFSLVEPQSCTLSAASTAISTTILMLLLLTYLNTCSLFVVLSIVGTVLMIWVVGLWCITAFVWCNIFWGDQYESTEWLLVLWYWQNNGLEDHWETGCSWCCLGDPREIRCSW